MFIFAGRALGTLAGLICAGIVAFVLGGCASSPRSSALALAERSAASGVRQCRTGGAQLCVAHGPRREDVRCGCGDVDALQASFDRLIAPDR